MTGRLVSVNTRLASAMLKLAVILFFALLYYAHQVSDLDSPLNQPLSTFRQGQFGLLGYAIFCNIALIGMLYMIGLRSAGQPAEAANTLVAICILLIVVATPSWELVHNLAALALLATLFMYYAVLLYRDAARPWLIIHLLIPIVLAVILRFQSYGVWQKSLISYYVLAAMIHLHLVTRAARRPRAAEPDVFYKNRKVYKITTAQDWPRQR
jgi:hypothetical protein